MRCLVIEDFGTNYDESKQESYLSTYNFNSKTTVVKRSLAKALEYIDSDYNTFDTVILDIDLELGDHNVIIDKLKDIVPSTIIDNNQIISPTDLRRDAGFYVFLKLLHKGFPKDRIAFLTGNGGNSIYVCVDELITLLNGSKLSSNFNGSTDKTYIDVYEKQKENILAHLREISEISPDFTDELVDHISNHNFKDALDELIKFKRQHASVGSNTFGEWTAKFTAAGIKSPLGFRKNQEAEEFIRWKNSKEHSYYKLRSAIILACREITKLLLDEGDSVIKLHDFVYNGKNKADKVSLYSPSYFIDMLNMVESMLPIQADNNKSNIYRQMMKTISHDWEACVACEPSKDTDSLADIESGAYSCIMKLVRNWVSHNKLTDFTEESAAFIFIAAMRTMFKLPSEALGYEIELLDLIEDKPIDYKYLSDLFNPKEHKKLLINDMNTSFYALLDKANNKQVSPYELLKDIGGIKQNIKMNIKHLYKMLWHGVFYVSLEPVFNSTLNSLGINHSLKSSLISRDNSILTLLCRHTYSKTFKQANI